MSLELKNDDYAEIIKSLLETVRRQQITIDDLVSQDKLRNGSLRYSLEGITAKLCSIHNQLDVLTKDKLNNKFGSNFIYADTDMIKGDKTNDETK